MAEKTGGHSVTTTTGRSASSDELGILDLLEQELLNIVETTLINGLSEKLTRRLGAVSFELRHVNIINEEDLFGVGHFGSQKILTLLFEVTFEGVLQILAGSLSREVDEGGFDSVISGH